jgi:hypothetical protein
MNGGRCILLRSFISKETILSSNREGTGEEEHETLQPETG